MLQFARIQSTPVLAKGAIYDGWQADALAAPAACWDGVRFVSTISLWNIAASQWASGIFTSPDLTTWTYVPGSLLTPSGPDYILGNSGLAFFQGKYWMAYNHYPSAGTGDVTIANSTDRVHWTVVNDAVTGAQAYDPSLSVNPATGRLELWSVTAARKITLQDSADGLSWTGHGIVLDSTFWNVTNFGEPAAFYVGGVRYLTFDASPGTGRVTALAVEVSGTLTALYSVLGPDPFNAWEASQVFDGVVIGAFDRGDGRGSCLWMLYAGGDTTAATDNTDSSIGLAFRTLPAPAAAGSIAGFFFCA